jgi:hypothetical protein
VFQSTLPYSSHQELSDRLLQWESYKTRLGFRIRCLECTPSMTHKTPDRVISKYKFPEQTRRIHYKSTFHRLGMYLLNVRAFVSVYGVA